MMKPDKTLSREELYELVWNTPMVKLAKSLGLSDQGLAKKCKKHNIPRPPQGYWVKLEFGKHIEKTPLPDNDDESLETIHFYLYSEKKQLPPTPKNGKDDALLVKARGFKIPERVSRYHSLVTEYRKSADHNYVDQFGHIICRRAAIGPDIKVTQGSYKRACRFLQGIINLFGDCGWQLKEFSYQHSDSKYAAFVFGDDELRIKLKEPVKRVDHVKTKEEIERNYSWGPKYDYIPSGLLEFSIENLYAPGFKTSWKDTNKEMLEDQLVSIVQGYSRDFERHKKIRLEREAKHRKWEEEEQKRKQTLKLQKIEEKRRQYLYKLAEDHQKAKLIRSLVDDFSDLEDQDEGIKEWLAWASCEADSLCATKRQDEIVSKHKEIAQEDYYF